MQAPPIDQTEIDARVSEHLEELLQRWWDEQGECKPRDLELMASVLPFAGDQALRVLDLCCGPGDAGRAIHRRFPQSDVTFVDRDPLLLSICRGVNQRDGVTGQVMIADLSNDGWSHGLSRDYDAVVIANALHWLDAAQATAVMREIYARLRSGGVFVFAEPTSAGPPFAEGLAAWKATQAPRYSRENWQRFWLRANAILGYDHVQLMGARRANRIDEGMTTAGWSRLVGDAGLTNIDVLWRDADQVIVAALKA